VEVEGRGGCVQEQDCLSCRFQVIITNSPRTRALHDYLVHYDVERNHQGKDNVLLFLAATKAMNHGDGSVGCKERLGGLLKYYHREAA